MGQRAAGDRPPTCQREMLSWRPLALLLAALGLMVVAEVLTAMVHTGLGLALHAVLLVLFTWRAAIADGATHDLMAALSVLPLIRVLSIGMPFWLVDQPMHFALVNVPLMAGTVVAAAYLGYGRRQLGLTLGGLPWQVPVIASGVLIGYIERLIIQPPALVDELSVATVWWPVLSLILFTGLSEELLFRGVLQTAAVRALGAPVGILYVSLMFGALHIGWQSALDVAFVTLVGVFFAWVVYRTGSILGVSLSHGITNVMLFIVLPNVGQGRA
jgi:uncharacterized protein